MKTEQPPHQQPRSGDAEQGWDRPLGALLREARLHKGWTISDIGKRLHLTSAIVDAMEQDDLKRMGASVYARGYLNSYAHLVGVSPALVDRALEDLTLTDVEPPLQSASHTPRWQYLYDRYAKRVMYVALTGVIVFPIVLMGLRDRLPVSPPRLLSLDSVAPDAGAAGPASDENRAPVTASLAPFYRESGPVSSPLAASDDRVVGPADMEPLASVGTDPQAADPVPDTASEPMTDASLVLTFNGTSWVEVLAVDGRRLAYGLIAAGEVRRFDASAVGRVSIGDADAVSVTLDGRGLNLAEFRHAKVARFALSSTGKPVVPGG